MLSAKLSFRVLDPRTIDKRLVIACSDGDPDHSLTLDYDDVDQKKQRAFADKVVRALNEGFGK